MYYRLLIMLIISSFISEGALNSISKPRNAPTLTKADEIEDLQKIQTELKKDGALHLLIRYGNLAGVTLLLEQGANPNQADKHGLSPLEMAVHSYFGDHAQQIIETLLGFGATITPRSIEIAKRNGITPAVNLLEHPGERQEYKDAAETYVTRLFLNKQTKDTDNQSYRYPSY